MNKHLTNREFEIYMLIVEQAYSRSELSKKLNVSINTAETHVKSILKKMNCNSCLRMLVQYHKREGNL